MIQRLLKITHISDLQTAKNGRAYYIVKFEPKNSEQDGTPILSAIGQGTRTVFDAHTDDKGNEFKADSLFTQIAAGQAKEGMKIEGQVVKVRTTPYRIEGSTSDANTYTCVVFAHEEISTYVNRQLKSVYACMIDDSGYITAPEQTERPVGAPSTSSVKKEVAPAI